MFAGNFQFGMVQSWFSGMADRERDQVTNLGEGAGGATAATSAAALPQSLYIQPWRPPDIFSYLSHIVASPLQRHAAQSRIRLGHVDNPADGVKFRRSRVSARTQDRREYKGDQNGGCGGKNLARDL
jgi:hypothetical protein